MSDNIQLGEDTVDPIPLDTTVFRIGDLAREFGVTLRTLRFYEDKGLMKPSRSGTTRLYSFQDREKLRMALFCKRLGMSLEDIRRVLDLQSGQDADSGKEILKIYSSRLHVLRKELVEMQSTITNLELLVEELGQNQN